MRGAEPIAAAQGEQRRRTIGCAAQAALDRVRAGPYPPEAAGTVAASQDDWSRGTSRLVAEPNHRLVEVAAQQIGGDAQDAYDLAEPGLDLGRGWRTGRRVPVDVDELGDVGERRVQRRGDPIGRDAVHGRIVDGFESTSCLKVAWKSQHGLVFSTIKRAKDPCAF
jgi:hypothetical protein